MELPLWVKVDLRVMAMKRYYTFLRSLELEPHYQVQFSAIPKRPPFFYKIYSQYILSSLIGQVKSLIWIIKKITFNTNAGLTKLSFTYKLDRKLFYFSRAF